MGGDGSNADPVQHCSVCQILAVINLIGVLHCVKETTAARIMMDGNRENFRGKLTITNNFLSD